MARKRKEDIEKPSSPHWMTTYSDMVTLLLTFFVLLISFSTIDKVMFDKAMFSIRGALGVLKRNVSMLSNPTVPKESMLDQRRRAALYRNINAMKELARAMGYEKDISVEMTTTGFLIRMGSRVLFDLGSADLKPEAYPILQLVGEVLKEDVAEVVVCGHTDNLPIRSGKYPSNWELSTARALSVVKYLINKVGVPPEILVAAGYSEYRPLVPNTSEENRQKNRRVEFLVTWR
ncbi:MAG: flagellar motor protein MotB [Candidatus Marinimicrobia bacterium]|nr:flagellar motor protein MotB [Candidatus Neomarinimicrobiota bacterium]